MEDMPQTDYETIATITAGIHADPFSVLGIHESSSPGKKVFRAFIPGAKKMTVKSLSGKDLGYPEAIGEDGFFSGYLKTDRFQPVKLFLEGENGSKWEVHDPYSFGPVWGPMDDYFSAEGSHRKLYEKCGANFMEFEGVKGTHFAVWAPIG